MTKPFDIIIQGHFGFPLLSLKQIESKMKNGGISLYGFESVEAAEEFISHFPKYLKLKKTSCVGSNSFGLYGITKEQQDGSQYRIIGVSMMGMATNKATGEFNETGEKRFKKFAQIMKANNWI